MPGELGLWNNVGVVGLCVTAVYLFVTDRIVAGRRLRKAEADVERWQMVALKAMEASKTAILPAAEAVHALVTRLPDPGAEAEVESGSP